MRNSLLQITLTGLLLAACGTTPQGSSPEPESRAILSDETTIARTRYGRVQGYKDGEVFTFKGIPYAKAERFMPPQAPDTFEGVKMCRTYGPKTPQTSTTLGWREDRTDYGFGFQFNLEPVDEDNCLVLNVWTKGLSDGKKRPVFVWIHGGGFASGSGNDLPCYEGRALAKKGDIVVVNLNHRLNILGYIDLRGLGGKYAESVNLGMQDLVKALEWVRDNIEAFGGDPANVTIAGQSGGGGKVNTLMAMPSAMGLFHRAIAQSGSWILHNSDEEGKALGLQVIEELGLKPSQADRLQDFTYEELAAAGHRATVKLHSSNGFCPTVDGKYVTDPSFDPEAPEISRNIPMLLGSNKNEFTYDNSVALTQDEVLARLEKQMGKDKAAGFLKAYDAAYPVHTPQEVLYTDSFLRKAAVKMADAKSAQGAAPVYMYFFTWKPSGNALGACHGMELPFVFDNIALQREMTGGTPDAYRLSDLMSSAWIAFIKTGNPNVAGLPTWEPYTVANGNTMVFDKECKIIHNHDRGLLEYDLPRRF